MAWPHHFRGEEKGLTQRTTEEERRGRIGATRRENAGYGALMKEAGLKDQRYREDGREETREEVVDLGPMATTQVATSIKFGTSGWRGLIADDFTFANVRLAVRAIAEHLTDKKKHPTVLVGYDTRFYSEEFSALAVHILQEHGIHTLLCETFTPTVTPTKTPTQTPNHDDGVKPIETAPPPPPADSTTQAPFVAIPL